MPRNEKDHTKPNVHFPDTNTLIRDPHLVFKILEQDRSILILPMKVLEELDNKKKQMIFLKT